MMTHLPYGIVVKQFLGEDCDEGQRNGSLGREAS